MSKKRMDSTTMEAMKNELAGASLFFRRDQPNRAPEAPQSALEAPATTKQVSQVLKKEKQATKEPPEGSSMTPRYRDTTIPRHHDTVTPSTVESIRKAVKFVGKEAATHRFTPEEKQAIADIVYTYWRQGYKTSENEIARIGINWLIWDYQEHGSESILEQVLRALKQ